MSVQHGGDLVERTVQKVFFPSIEFPKKKKTAAYARVSSGKDSMLHSLAAQISYYSALIQSHSDWEYCGVYADEAITGTKDDRAGLNKLLDLCRDGLIDQIITKSVSRFARNTVDLLQIVRELKDVGIDIHFYKPLNYRVVFVYKKPRCLAAPRLKHRFDFLGRAIPHTVLIITESNKNCIFKMKT